MLLKNPQDLTENQQLAVAGLQRSGGLLWDAYQLKKSLREVFAGDLNPDAVMEMITTWCNLAAKSNIREFVKAAATIRSRTEGIYAAVTRSLSNGRHEGHNNKIRTMTRRAYGFHSPEAALALIMLACGPIEIKLAHHETPWAMAVSVAARPEETTASTSAPWSRRVERALAGTWAVTSEKVFRSHTDSSQK